MILCIDASSNTSGGGIRYLSGLIEYFDPNLYDFKKIIIWGSTSLLSDLPDKKFLDKKTHRLLNKGTLSLILWQIFFRDKLLKNNCDLLFSPSGIYNGLIRPYVGVSQNMLYYEKKERARFGFSFIRLKLKILSLIQKKSLKNSNGIIFLSDYAKKKISSLININKINNKVINFGVAFDFRKEPSPQREINHYDLEKPFRFLYVSTIFPYKHQWNVVLAISKIRKEGYPISLTLVGDGNKSSKKKLTKYINICDPKNSFIKWHKGIGLNEVIKFYHNSDAFIFASSCENMPNIIVEAMASGLPIASSNYEPMNEFLRNKAFYFNPLLIDEIYQTLKELVLNHDKRYKIASNCNFLSKKYTWKKCAKQTFSFLKDVKNDFKS